MTATVKCAAIYARISQDRSGEGLGVERQEALCRELAARKGWPVSEVYVDNDLTAYSGKVRPEYERMLASIREGSVDAVLCVDLDRLTRRPSELEEFILLADTKRVALANVSGDVDLASSEGRFHARMMGALARQESEKKSERIRREREARRRKGLPHPGARWFGFQPGNMEHHPEETALIRAAARDVLAGRSMSAVVQEWNARGVLTTRGREWTVNALRDLLTSHRVAGRLVHEREDVGPAAWPAILDMETWQRVRALAKSRRRGPGRPPKRLLTGLVMCSECDNLMVGSSDGKGRRRTYACHRSPSTSDTRCGRLSIGADDLDWYVTGAVVAMLEDGRLAKALAAQAGDRADTTALAEALEVAEARTRELEADYREEGLVTRAEYRRMKPRLQEREREARRALEQASASAPVSLSLPTAAEAWGAWWDAASADDRRTVLALLLEEVVVRPYDPAKPRAFDPERVDLRWRV